MVQSRGTVKPERDKTKVCMLTDRKRVNLLFKILPVHSATIFWSSSAWWKAGTQVLFCLGKKSVLNSQLSDGGFTART